MKFAVIGLLVILSGCSASGMKYEDSSSHYSTGSSEIIIFRKAKFAASGSAPCTKVNGDSLGLLKNGGFLRALVKPGKNLISMPLDDALGIELETKPGSTTYLEFTIGLAGMSVLPLGTITSVSTSWNMAMVLRDAGYSLEELSTIRESKYSEKCKI